MSSGWLWESSSGERWPLPVHPLAPPVNRSGTVTCNDVIGTAQTSPPLVPGGTATSDTVKLNVHLLECHASGSNVPSGVTFKGTGGGTFLATTSNCDELSTGNPFALVGMLNVKWVINKKAVPGGIGPSHLNFTTVTPILDGEYIPGNAGFTFSSVPVSGSFSPGPASGEVDSTVSGATLAAECPPSGSDESSSRSIRHPEGSQDQENQTGRRDRRTDGVARTCESGWV